VRCDAEHSKMVGLVRAKAMPSAISAGILARFSFRVSCGWTSPAMARREELDAREGVGAFMPSHWKAMPPNSGRSCAGGVGGRIERDRQHDAMGPRLRHHTPARHISWPTCARDQVAQRHVPQRQVAGVARLASTVETKAAPPCQHDNQLAVHRLGDRAREGPKKRLRQLAHRHHDRDGERRRSPRRRTGPRPKAQPAHGVGEGADQPQPQIGSSSSSRTGCCVPPWVSLRRGTPRGAPLSGAIIRRNGRRRATGVARPQRHSAPDEQYQGNAMKRRTLLAAAIAAPSIAALSSPGPPSPSAGSCRSRRAAAPTR